LPQVRLGEEDTVLGTAFSSITRLAVLIETIG